MLLRSSILLVLLLFGCKNKDDDNFYFTHITLRGVKVMVPNWLNDQSLIDQALQEIDDSGVPVDYKIIIELPVFEYKNRLVRGLVSTDIKLIRVGWRMSSYETIPLLPALKHEVGHIYFGPCFEHEGDPGCPMSSEN